MYRIILCILILFLYGVCYSGISDTNGINKNPSECLLQTGETQRAAVVVAAVAAVDIEKLTDIDAEIVQQVANAALEFSNENPEMTASVALVLSILFLMDSGNVDYYNKIAIYNRVNEMNDIDEDFRLKTLEDMEMLLKADQNRLWTMVVMKGVCTVALGYIALYSKMTTGPFCVMIGAVGIGGAAALIDGYNYYNLSTLMTKL